MSAVSKKVMPASRASESSLDEAGTVALKYAPDARAPDAILGDPEIRLAERARTRTRAVCPKRDAAGTSAASKLSCEAALRAESPSDELECAASRERKNSKAMNHEELQRTYAEDGYVVLRNVVSREKLLELRTTLVDAFDTAKRTGGLLAGGGHSSAGTSTAFRAKAPGSSTRP
jgi:hypothetical protein